MLRSSSVVFAAITLAACGPNLPGKNTSAQLIEAVRAGDQASVRRLVATGASLLTIDGAQSDQAAVITTLKGLSVGSATVEAHHEVARVTLSDGRLLFVQAHGSQVDLMAVFPGTPNAERSTAIKNYQDAWNTTDSAARTSLLNKAWSATGHYVDPSTEGTGTSGLDTAISGFQQAFPKATVDTPNSQMISLSNGWFTFDWVLHGADGSASPGFDVGHFSSDGLVDSINGFFTARTK